jgi:hypothetical protein
VSTDTAHTVDRPRGGAARDGSGVPLISLVLSGALRIHPPERERAAEPPRDD